MHSSHSLSIILRNERTRRQKTRRRKGRTRRSMIRRRRRWVLWEDNFFSFYSHALTMHLPHFLFIITKGMYLPFAATGRPRRTTGEMKEGNFLFFFLFHIKICTMHLSHFFFIILRITNERNEPSVRSNSAETNGRDAGDRWDSRWVLWGVILLK